MANCLEIAATGLAPSAKELHGQACQRTCQQRTCRVFKRMAASESFIPAARGLKRQRVAVLAAASPAQEKAKEEDGTFTAMYERETPLVSVLLEELDQEFAAAGEAGIEELEAERKQIVRAVVARHYQDMSQGLLMVLAGYAQAAYSKGQDHVAETLEMLREEILSMSAGQMPVEMQVLDELVSMIDEPKEERMKLILDIDGETGDDGEEKEGTPTSLGSLRTTATRMLEDMESHDIVIDRRLLVRLCLVREEIDEAATKLKQPGAVSQYHDMMTTSFRLLPMGNAAYVKEVLGVGSPEKRKALLEMCFKNDFATSKDSQLLKKWRQQGVRPGRLMNTIKALLTALEERGISADSPEVRRLKEMQGMAVSILMSLKDNPT